MQILEYIEKKKPNSRYMTKEMDWVNSVLSYHYSPNIPPAPLQNKINNKIKCKEKFPGLVVKKVWVVFWLQLSSLPDSFLFFVVVSSWATYDCLTDFLTGDIIACNCCESKNHDKKKDYGPKIITFVEQPRSATFLQFCNQKLFSELRIHSIQLLCQGASI
jgi:hypothetical protein